MNDSPSDKYLRLVPFFIATSVVILVVLIVIVISLVNSKRITNPVSNVSKSTVDTSITSPTPIPQSYPAPSVTFTSYEKKPGLVYPQVPAYVSTYTLKSPLSDNDALAMAQAVGVSESKKQDVGSSKITYYSTSNPDTIGYLMVDKKTGAFTFQSYGLHKGDTSIDTKQNPGAYALSFVARLGVDTASVSCPITYKQKDSPLTYIECHRDFKTAGAPILGYPGILNIAEDTPLRSLTVGRASNTEEDPSITEVSLLAPKTLLPEERGKARPNDFNTVTVALADDGRVVSVVSNLRLIQKITSASAQELLSPEEAYTAFAAHQSEMMLTIPAGQGFVDWKKVYPGNVGQGKTATITDYLLTYVENPATIAQSSLELKYLIRGIATLDSGYTVRFVQIIPALRTSFTSTIQASAQNGSKRNVYADDPTNKVGRLGFEVSGTPTETPVPGSTNTPMPTLTIPPPEVGTNTPTPTVSTITPKPPELSCTANVTTINIVLPGGESVEVAALGAGHTMFLVSSTNPNISYDEVRQAIYSRAVDQLVIYIARTALGRHNQGITAPMNFEDVMATHNIELDGMQYYPEYSNIAMDNYNTSVLSNGIEGLGGIREWANKVDLFTPSVLNTFFLIFRTPASYYSLNGCIYITGESPSLFLYSSTPLSSNVKLSFPLTYTDAPYHSKTSTSASFMADSGPVGNLSFSGGKITRPYLYYEYDPKTVTLNTITKTWHIPFAQWSGKVQEIIAKDLGLNPKETKTLISDIEKALTDDISIQKASYLKLSLVDEKEVNRKLPLTISPQPESVYRIHILVEGSQTFKENVGKLPSRFPLQRGQHYAVEVGARIKLR